MSTIKWQELEVGSLMWSRNRVGRIVRFTKTQAVVQLVQDDDLVTPATNYQDKVIEFRVMLDREYSQGGKEVGSGSRFVTWEPITEEKVREHQENRNKANEKRKAAQVEQKAREQARLKQALTLIGNLAGKGNLEGPMNLKMFSFESPSEDVGDVQFVFSVEEGEEWDWSSGEKVKVKVLSVASWYVMYPGTTHDRVERRNHNSVSGRTIKDALAELIAGWYLQ